MTTDIDRQIQIAEEEGNGRVMTSTAVEYTAWNRETGESSIVMFDALPARIRQRFPDDHPNPAFRGQKVYTFVKNDAPRAVRGDLACPLSYQEPDPEARALGWGVGAKGCNKPHYYLTEYDVEEHVRTAHPKFYAQRESKRESDRRREDQERQERIYEAMLDRNQRGRPRKGQDDAEG